MLARVESMIQLSTRTEFCWSILFVHMFGQRHDVASDVAMQLVIVVARSEYQTTSVSPAVARVATEILDPPFLSALGTVRLSTTQEQMLQAQSDASSLRNQLQVGRLVKLWKKKQQLEISEIETCIYIYIIYIQLNKKHLNTHTLSDWCCVKAQSFW